MSVSLVLALIWLVAANVIAMLPSRSGHRVPAFALIVIGIPLLGLVTWQNGPFAGLLALVAGASVLRWPLIYLSRRLRRSGRHNAGARHAGARSKRP